MIRKCMLRRRVRGMIRRIITMTIMAIGRGLVIGRGEMRRGRGRRGRWIIISIRRNRN